MVRLGPQVTEWPYRLCFGHPVVDAQTWETYEFEAVQHSVLGVVVTDVVMALQEEDLEHQHLVIVGPTALGWGPSTHPGGRNGSS